MSKFLKSTDIQITGKGYLTTKDSEPINNDAFVAAQKHAEYIVTFAEMAKGKSFETKQGYDLNKLKREVTEKLNDSRRTFVEGPKAVKQKLSAQLKEEAMAFLNYKEDASKAEKTNEFLQQFEVLAEFEDFGLFFEEGIVKLNKIYTLKEVVEAVKATIDLLD